MIAARRPDNPEMSANQPWRVFRFDFWIDPVFNQRMAEAGNIDLRVAKRGDEATAWAMLADAHVYQISAAKNELAKPFHAHDALLARCPKLLCVSSGGAGFDTVDVAACTKAGVAVVNQSGGNADAVAEMTIGLLLAVARRIVECDRKLRTERGFPRESLMGRDLRGRTLGIVGIGNAGRRVAKLAAAFGMRVLATDPFVAPEEIRTRGAEPVALDDLVRESDVVSLHCPRDATTMNMFDRQRFAAMKKGAYFITTARGGIHDEAALAEALRSGHLAGAGLDVWEPEPPALDSPLLKLPNVVATYHTAGVSEGARYNVARMGAEQIVAFLKGERPPRLVNPEVWPVVEKRLGKSM